MVPAYLSLLAFLLLLLWRLVFADLKLTRRSLARPLGAQQARDDSVFKQFLLISVRSSMDLFSGNGLENPPESASPGTRKERAERYLARVVALTGASQMGNGYVLDVGATRFHVREGYVGQMQDLNDPKCAYKETCFYSTCREIPKAEQIAAALLQLASNPALFDKWVVQDGRMFKADGQVFTRSK
jgi:hypothetical protein